LGRLEELDGAGRDALFFSFMFHFSAEGRARNSLLTKFDTARRMDSTQLVEAKGARRADSSASARNLN
jgi:hypothetical protein